MSKHSAIPCSNSPSVTLAELRLSNLPQHSSKPSLHRWLQRLLTSVRWRSDALRTSPERSTPLQDAHLRVVAADLEDALTLLRSRQYKGRQLTVEETASSRMDRSAVRFYITNVSLRTSTAQLEQHVAQLTGCSPLAVSIHAGTGPHTGISNFAFVGMPAAAKDQIARVRGSQLNDRRLLCKLSDDRSYVPGRSGVSSTAYRAPALPSPSAAERPPPSPVFEPLEMAEPLSPEEAPQAASLPISPVSIPSDDSGPRPRSACASYSSTPPSSASSSSSEPTPPGGMYVPYAAADDSKASHYLPAAPAKNLAEYASAASELGRVFSTLAELQTQRSALVEQRIECEKEIERLQSASQRLRDAETNCLTQVERLQREHAQLSEFLRLALAQRVSS